MIAGLGGHLVPSQDQTTIGTKHAAPGVPQAVANILTRAPGAASHWELPSACLPSHHPPQSALFSSQPCATLLPWNKHLLLTVQEMLPSQPTHVVGGWGSHQLPGSSICKLSPKGALPECSASHPLSSSREQQALPHMAPSPAALSNCTSSSFKPLLQEPQCTFKMSPMTSPFSWVLHSSSLASCSSSIEIFPCRISIFSSEHFWGQR